MSLKQNRIIKIVMEFVKAGTSYDITGIDLGLAKFFYRESQMLFQDLATGDYTISTGGGKQTLTITNPELLSKIEAFQVAYILDFDASKYDTQWNVDINTLKDKYNQLLDVTFNVWEYIRKVGFVADDTAMQIILPQLNTGEVWVKTDAGWRGLNVGDIESNINAFWIEFNKKTQEILEQIVAAGKVQEGLLEDFTQQKIKEINEEGLKLEVTQVGHGFVFNAVQFDKTTGAYTKADINTGADGIAVRIDDDRFYLSSNGIIEIPANAVDSKGNPYELDEYYFLDNDIVGGCTPEKPTHIFQALFCVVNKKGVKSAIVEIGDPIDLNPRILVDEINSLGLATTDQVVLSEPTIADLIASKKYKVGDVVQVLGYYAKGDGGGHPRQKKPVGYNGADAVIGADGSIWGLVNSDEINIMWLGAKGNGVDLDDSYFTKLMDLHKKGGSDSPKKIVLGNGKANFKLSDDFVLTFNHLERYHITIEGNACTISGRVILHWFRDMIVNNVQFRDARCGLVARVTFINCYFTKLETGYNPNLSGFYNNQYFFAWNRFEGHCQIVDMILGSQDRSNGFNNQNSWNGTRFDNSIVVNVHNSGFDMEGQNFISCDFGGQPTFVKSNSNTGIMNATVFGCYFDGLRKMENFDFLEVYDFGSFWVDMNASPFEGTEDMKNADMVSLNNSRGTCAYLPITPITARANKEERKSFPFNVSLNGSPSRAILQTLKIDNILNKALTFKFRVNSTNIEQYKQIGVWNFKFYDKNENLLRTDTRSLLFNVINEEQLSTLKITRCDGAVKVSVDLTFVASTSSIDVLDFFVNDGISTFNSIKTHEVDYKKLILKRSSTFNFGKDINLTLSNFEDGLHKIKAVGWFQNGDNIVYRETLFSVYISNGNIIKNAIVDDENTDFSDNNSTLVISIVGNNVNFKAVSSYGSTSTNYYQEVYLFL